MFSPQAVIDAWYMPGPPWELKFADANSKSVTRMCRDLLQLRMSFVPYLYSAFMEYNRTGMPPFRALVMDYPDDPKVWNCDLQYMMGDRVMVAPVVAGTKESDVYLPKGGWRDFWTGKRYEGGETYKLPVPLAKMLLFVKDNSLLPMAGAAQNVEDPLLHQLTVRVYGTGANGCTLYEDDGVTLAYRTGAVNTVDLTWDPAKQAGALTRTGNTNAPAYEAVKWVEYK